MHVWAVSYNAAPQPATQSSVRPIRLQGGIAARRLRVSVHTFEVRECHPHPFATNSSLLHLIPHPLNSTHAQTPYGVHPAPSHRRASSTAGTSPAPNRRLSAHQPHASAATAAAAAAAAFLPTAMPRPLMGERVGEALAAAAGLVPGYCGSSAARKRHARGIKVLSYRCVACCRCPLPLQVCLTLS